ncbi:hypothetical protein RRG08_060303 [Elysia crispata]|uniref:Uncharacterized protein n=1 Tax=Elysia crispata TaxID=231223 RepID=A0AAE1CRK1_9GAST|nr:hypothetical protein RRG08_060303 [Elysia crispata]
MVLRHLFQDRKQEVSLRSPAEGGGPAHTSRQSSQTLITPPVSASAHACSRESLPVKEEPWRKFVRFVTFIRNGYQTRTSIVLEHYNMADVRTFYTSFLWLNELISSRSRLLQNKTKLDLAPAKMDQTESEKQNPKVAVSISSQTGREIPSCLCSKRAEVVGERPGPWKGTSLQVRYLGQTEVSVSEAEINLDVPSVGGSDDRRSLGAAGTGWVFLSYSPGLEWAQIFPIAPSLIRGDGHVPRGLGHLGVTDRYSHLINYDPVVLSAGRGKRPDWSRDGRWTSNRVEESSCVDGDGGRRLEKMFLAVKAVIGAGLPDKPQFNLLSASRLTPASATTVKRADHTRRQLLRFYLAFAGSLCLPRWLDKHSLSVLLDHMTLGGLMIERLPL